MTGSVGERFAEQHGADSVENRNQLGAAWNGVS